MRRSHLEEYGRRSSGNPFGHLIHYIFKCCIAEFGLNCLFKEERALVLDVRPVCDVYWELRALPVELHLVSFK